MKPPAFQFYADDFIGGTVGMSAEEVGAYIRLLCYQWGNGSIPPQQAVVDRIAGCQVSQMVLSKFQDGKNPRLESVRSKQQAFSETQRKKANMLWQSRGNAVASNGHMPTVCSPISDLRSPSPSSTPIEATRFAPPSEAESKLHAEKCGLPEIERQKFMAHYESNGWMVSGRKMKSWKAAMTKWKLNWETNRYGTNSTHRNSGIIGHSPVGPSKAERVLAERERLAKESPQLGLATQVAGHGANPPFGSSNGGPS